MNRYNIGIDIGSTTLKAVLVDRESRSVVLNIYQRHQAKVRECLHGCLRAIREQFGEAELSVCLTGSVGMGIAERWSLPFVQEVVAATQYIRIYHPDVSTMIDIGGEDAKMVFFSEGHPSDLRMNGNCAGGTGAFIDQMAILLGVSPEELGALAESATQVYPIASRCGVFCKTDIQNLIARNASRADIAASIFRAVAVQTVTTLAHGHEINAPVLLCGGPLSFIPALRKAFAEYLGLPPESLILPDKANLIPAWGAALTKNGLTLTVPDLIRRIDGNPALKGQSEAARLAPIFGSREEYEAWKKQMSQHAIERAPWPTGPATVFLGIDSGSTTTKIAVLDRKGRMLFSHYRNNNGNPVRAVEEGLRELAVQCREHGTTLQVAGSCSTGYGEDLIKAAFSLNTGIVETMVHYMAARNMEQQVSFVLDIGGQDMKAIFADNGAITRIEVNEACSSGCGSFISTFAQSLDSTVGAFARAACLAPSPCDLGTRCTVFMNSKVKQVLREGASVSDIAAGLSYSVVRNYLYKVLRLKDTSALGEHIVVQGGTMRNDSVVRALEKLTGKRVLRSDCPELMGAWGCALYAMQAQAATAVSLEEMLAKAAYTSGTLHCHGCENQCAITRYRFENGNSYVSGNRCEKVFTSSGSKQEHGLNVYEKKRSLLFGRSKELPHPRMVIGIPRCLNMYEEYPFWHTLLTKCGLQVRLSEVSNFTHYEQCAGKVMSDNICFPAKLVHSHIDDLQRRGVDRIFMPFVVYEKKDPRMLNSYNCPIVTGYSQVIRSVQAGAVPIDSPTVSFKDKAALRRQCEEYLTGLGVPASVVRQAVRQAYDAQEHYEREITEYNESVLTEARKKGRLAIMLAGRPYHADPLIQHKVSEMIAAQGAYVLTDDLVRRKDIELSGVNYLSQWSYPNRIMKSAAWVSQTGEEVQYMQLTSFGCGPDAFMTDEVQTLLRNHGKNLTLLKIDDVNNTGSLKLRVRSLVESLRTKAEETKNCKSDTVSLPPYTEKHAGRKIIVPFFTPFISPLIPSLMKLAGYNVENLPMSDNASCDWGLKYSNNEICYPATLVVGDIMKAFKSGAYNPDTTCVAMVQTGGQCRASNYFSLIRKALMEGGYTNTPVISVTFGGGIKNEQPGFRVNWPKMLPIALAAVLYSDCIAKFYYASVVRENISGEVRRLRDRYLDAATGPITRNRPDELYDHLFLAAADFNRICRNEDHPKVGIVGEIFLKFHPFAQRHVTDWLVSQGIEVVYPALSDFFLQGFVNAKNRKENHTGNRFLPEFVIDFFYKKVQKQLERVNAYGSRFSYFIPFDNIFDKAKLARSAISLSTQFGEGWLIAGEVAALARQGIGHVISLQPFGCIANHIVEKGIENRLKLFYPQLNILSLDFDSSVSGVNITNRLLLFINNLQNNNHGSYRKYQYGAADHTGCQTGVH